MLTDPKMGKEIGNSTSWEGSPLRKFTIRTEEVGPDGKPMLKSNSFSGGERNRLVMHKADGHFKDYSLVSGVDCKEDARSFAMLDFDNDGWLDIALPSCNAPRFRLFRNRFGELGEKGRVVEVVLRGGHTGSGPSTEYSNRDGIGAVLTATVSGQTRVYRRSIGEGNAAQNTGTLRVTLGEGQVLEKLSVRWPSGKVSELVPEADRRIVTIQEQ